MTVDKQAKLIAGGGAALLMVLIAVSLFGPETVWNDWKSALIALLALGGVTAVLWVIVQIGTAVERCRRQAN